MKRSKMLFSSIFASFLAIAAFSGVMVAKNTQHVQKVEAAGSTESLKTYNVVFADEANVGLNTIHIWNVSYDSESYDRTDLEYWFDNYKGPITTGSVNNNTTATYNSSDGSFDITQSTSVTGWYSKGGKQYVFTFPHYVSGFNVIFKKSSSWDKQSPTYSLSSKQRVLYGSWGDGGNHYGPESQDTSHTENFTYYTVTKKYGNTTVGTSKAYAYSYFDVPDAYSPSGYTFKGWYTDPQLGTKYETAQVLSNTMTLYAKCSKTVYTALKNGVSVGEMSESATAGEFVIKIDVAHGDIITFNKDSDAYNVTKDPASNNNYDNGVIFSATNVDLYLKTASNQFWLAGMPATNNSHYLLINGDIGELLSVNPDDQTEKYGANIHFGVNDFITFAYIDAQSSTYSRYSLGLKDGVDLNLFKYENDKIKCLVDGYYNIYIGVTGSGDGAYIESVNGGAAYNYALDFNNKIGAICNTVGSSGYLPALATEWGKQSTNFSSLHITVKDTLRTASANPDSTNEIEKFAAKYLRIIYLYGTSSFPNFVGRTDVSTPSAHRGLQLLSNGQSMNTISVIAIVSAISVVAVGGYFLLRKKKEN